jgi:hypothetical protein
MAKKKVWKIEPGANALKLFSSSLEPTRGKHLSVVPLLDNSLLYPKT